MKCRQRMRDRARVFPHLTEANHKRIVLWFTEKPSETLLNLLRMHAQYAQFNGGNYGWFVQRDSWPKLLAKLKQHNYDDLARRVQDCIQRWQISDADEAEGGRPPFLWTRDLPPWWKKNRKKRR